MDTRKTNSRPYDMLLLMETPRTSTDWLVDHLVAALDARNGVPRYETLMRELRALIERRVLTANQPLPPEPELAKRLGLSRQTVNQALTSLARDGLLVRRRGIGTFPAEPVVEQPLDGLYSFIRTLTAQGLRPGSRLLGARVTVDDHASAFLTERPDGLVYELTRMRLVDGEPLIYEEAFLPVECGERLPQDRLTSEVLYELLEECCGIAVTHAEETMWPVVVDRRQAALLGIVVGNPAFLVERRTYAGTRPAELRRSLIRGDRYRFRAHLDARAL